MRCVNHLDKDAQGICNHCGRSICSDCTVQLKGENYCSVCIAAGSIPDKKEGHSAPLAAILSFVIAGSGQVYNGQYAKGILIFLTSWLVIPWIIGIFDAYHTAKKINEGKIAVKPKTGCLAAFLVGSVVFLFGILILALLAAIAIPNLLRARLNANESQAAENLRVVSTAIETYRAANNGAYPLSEDNLVTSDKPYLSKIFNNETVYGYIYSEELRSDGYRIVAAPVNCGVTGSKIFTMDSGGALSTKECGNK
ncbi:MAG: hypothetical protein WC628_08290 [Candidatus Omnitrophota bacterium]